MRLFSWLREQDNTTELSQPSWRGLLAWLLAAVSVGSGSAGFVGSTSWGTGEIMGFIALRALKGFTLVLLFTGIAAVPVRADVAYSWGVNSLGELGNGTPGFAIATPAAVSVLTSNVSAIAAGGSSGLAVQNGGVYGWGLNDSGQVGDGTTTPSIRPAPVALTGDLSSGVSAVAGGQRYSLAVRNGGVYAWGNNAYGQMGNGTTTPLVQPTPVALTGDLSSGVTAISAGQRHSLALRNGGVYAWGSNFQGQLGDGTTMPQVQPTPVALTGLMSSGVTAVSAGHFHSLALRSGGVYAWGSNTDGELGDGSMTDRNAPVTLTGLMSSGVTAVAAGNRFSLAVRNGGVYAWGNNPGGQLGDGTMTDTSIPEQIDPADLHDIVAVAAGQYSSYALSSDGSIWDWGFNDAGQLGLGTFVNRNYLTPQHLLPPIGYRFTSIAPGTLASFAVATVAAVPEPSTLALAGIAMLTLFTRASRWRRATTR